MSSSLPPPPPTTTTPVPTEEGATDGNAAPQPGGAADEPGASQDPHPLLRDETAGMNPVALLTGYYGPRRGERIRHVVHEGALRLPATVVGTASTTTTGDSSSLSSSVFLLGQEAMEAWREANRPSTSKLAKGKTTTTTTARFVLPSLETGVVRPSLDPSLPSYTVTTVQREEVVDEEEPADTVPYNPANDTADATNGNTTTASASLAPPPLPKRTVYRMVATNRTLVRGQRIRGGGGDEEEENSKDNPPASSADPSMDSATAATTTAEQQTTATATLETEKLSLSAAPTSQIDEVVPPPVLDPPVPQVPASTNTTMDPSPSAPTGMVVQEPLEIPAVVASTLVSAVPSVTSTTRPDPAETATTTTTVSAITAAQTSDVASISSVMVQAVGSTATDVVPGTVAPSVAAVPVSSNIAPSTIALAATVTSTTVPSAAATLPSVASAVPSSNSMDVSPPTTVSEDKPAPVATTATVPVTAHVPILEETKSSSTTTEQPHKQKEDAQPATAPSSVIEPPPEPRVLPLDEKPVPQWHQLKPSGESDDTTSTNVLLLTPKPSWYHPDQVSALERALLPEWFDGSAAHRTVTTYLETRNAMVDMAAALGHTRFVTGTLVRRSIPGDAGSLLRLHALLTAHRVMNADAINDSMPTPAAFLLPTTTTTAAASRSTAAVWSDPHRKRALMEAVVEQANKRMKIDDDVQHNDDDDNDNVIIDWEVVAATVGHGVTARDCQGQFLALPLEEEEDASHRNGSITPDAAPSSSSRKPQIERDFVMRLVNRADPVVLQRVTQSLLRSSSTRSNPKDEVAPPSSSAAAAAVLGLTIQQATLQQQQQQQQAPNNVAQLLSELVELRMQKLENRLAMLDDVEGMLDAERLALELERRDLYTARCRHWFGGA